MNEIILSLYLFFDEIVAFCFTIFNYDIDIANSESSLYVYLKVLLGVWAIMVVLLDIIKRKEVKTFFIAISCVFIVVGLLIMGTSLNSINVLLPKTSLIIFTYLFPFLLFLANSLSEIRFNLVLKYSKYIIYLLIISGVLGLVIPSLQGNPTQALNGFTYQSTSYFYSKGIMLVLVNSMNKKNSKKQVLNYLTIIFFLYLSILSGGKGAVLTTVICSVIFLKYAKIEILKMIKLISVVGALIYISSFIIRKSDIFLKGFYRSISFISLNKDVFLQNSTGRDAIYKTALTLISERPFFGYGIGSAYYTVLGIYPHNLFLEILIDGGFVLFIFFIFLIYFTLIYLKRNAKKSVSYLFLYLGFIFNFIHLQFSSSYLFGNYFFWLGILLFLNRAVLKKGEDIYENNDILRQFKYQ
ncbi:O-antigen ligase family protein [Vagococcus lutrae]|uniref:O-antigen ligase family protein n=1 Tax=Vagococcus lutrae TaxID=81947 RepID=UPI00232C9755|nr:O-antigen ligase family protein [Vagococcus lutrae]WCG04783.1 O-antigen ligase family protein [Vagococcus lutrae]